MLHAALAGFILAWIYKFLDKKYIKRDEMHAEIDWWMAFAVVIASSVTIWVFSLFVVSFQLPESLLLVGYFFYLIIPFVIIKFMLEYDAKKALSYAIWVPFITILAEVPFALLQQGVKTA